MKRRQARLSSAQKTGKEARMAAFVVAWLEGLGWDVYQEVKYASAVADIVAVKEGVVWIIECKTSVNLTLMMQICRHPSHRRSIAVPALGGHWRSDGETVQSKFHSYSNERQFAYRMAEDFCQAGVLEVTAEGNITEVRAAPPRSSEAAAAIIATLRPEHKTFAKAGERGGGFWTPYKGTINQVRELLGRHPWGLSMKDIVKALGKCHYASDRSARQQLKNALEGWEADWCLTLDGHEERDLITKYRLRNP